MPALNIPQSASSESLEPAENVEQVPSTPTNAFNHFTFSHYQPDSSIGMTSSPHRATFGNARSTPEQQGSHSSPSVIRGLVQYAHLPTPQSPGMSSLSVGAVPQTPESPLRSGSHSYYAPLNRLQPATTRKPEAMSVISTPSRHTQIITPDSSPFTSLLRQPAGDGNDRAQASARLDFSFAPTEPNTPTGPAPFSATSVFAVDSPNASQPATPQLSSPFQAKASRPGNELNIAQVLLPPASVDELGPSNASPSAANMSTPPLAPASIPQFDFTSLHPNAGGEMDRLRHAQLMQQQNRLQDLESRRPDYLVRNKRTMSEADPSSLMEDEMLRDRERFGTVGITDSPHKGRRLTLFQETSEESFEESLMAGGYGRYRTAEWVRQPQPLPPTILQTPGPAGPSQAAATIVEEIKSESPAPLSDKQARKLKRLAAFKGDGEHGSTSRLYAVEMEGKGRVLLDTPNESVTVIDVTASKKRQGANKRKKRVEAVAAKENQAVVEVAPDHPNWPDTEFPWRLRTEERRDSAKAEEEERLKWIERFLDRDTDDEDDTSSNNAGCLDDPEAEVLPSSKWGFIYEDDTERPVPYARGRGKMVPLHADPAQQQIKRSAEAPKKRSAYFPSDPADARAALMSKKNVRALSYRKERKIRGNHLGGEAICVCRGQDDGRDLVQCDDCQDWFHLDCLGIDNIRDLGPETIAWYCDDCSDAKEAEMASDHSANALMEEPYATEPTFAPTDDAPRYWRSLDRTFFQAPPDSPLPNWGSQKAAPKTPTRRRDDPDGVSKLGTTPRQPLGFNHNFDDLHFDPTSTPSRGIKVGGAFSGTPRNNVSYQTPRQVGRPRTFGGPGFLDDSVSSPYMRPLYEDSPVRRNRSLDAVRPRKLFDTPRAERPQQRVTGM